LTLLDLKDMAKTPMQKLNIVGEVSNILKGEI
jgi:hypothetical protein